jgi:short subunit dehydrogenase-like uncharacterized protein
VKELEDQSLCKTREVILSSTKLDADPSGGTIDSMLHSIDQDPKEAAALHEPWVLSPKKGRQSSDSTNFLAIRHDAHLGELSASSYGAVQDRAVIHRTWGLLADSEEGYGDDFYYNEYRKVPNMFMGLFVILSNYVLMAVLSFGPLRPITKRFLPQPGSGPDLDAARKSSVEMEAVAIADSEDAKKAPRAYGKFVFTEGGPYYLTAAFLAQGAASLLYDRKLEAGVEGGCLTPAFLGAELMRRMEDVGGGLKGPRLLQKWEYVG